MKGIILVKTGVLIICLLLSGCPAQFKVSVKNKTDGVISILSGYSDAILSKIEAGETQKVIYNFDCFRVRSEDLILEYTPIMPPKEYVKNGFFSSSFKAVFTSDKNFKIYVDDNESKEDVYLAKGCKE